MSIIADVLYGPCHRSPNTPSIFFLPQVRSTVSSSGAVTSTTFSTSTVFSTTFSSVTTFSTSTSLITSTSLTTSTVSVEPQARIKDVSEKIATKDMKLLLENISPPSLV